MLHNFFSCVCMECLYVPIKKEGWIQTIFHKWKVLPYFKWVFVVCCCILLISPKLCFGKGVPFEELTGPVMKLEVTQQLVLANSVLIFCRVLIQIRAIVNVERSSQVQPSPLMKHPRHVL